MRKQNNGRFSFVFRSPEVTIEVCNLINRLYYFKNLDDTVVNGLIPPKPFHYIIENKKEATTPLYVNIREYIEAVEKEFPDRFNIKSEVALIDPKRQINMKMQRR
jgi:hypothetical protein